jgi:hypothetical protein
MSCGGVFASLGDIFSLSRGGGGGGGPGRVVVFVARGFLHLDLDAGELVGQLVGGYLAMRILGNVEVLVHLVGGALGNTLEAAGLLYFVSFLGRLLGGVESGVGWQGEIDVGGEIVFFSEVGGFEGTEGFGVFNLGAAAFPGAGVVEAGGDLLEHVEQGIGSAEVDAVVGEGVADLLEGGLHGVHVVEDGEAEAAGFAFAAGLGHLNATGAEVEVEIAEALVMKSGRAAEDAIFHEMVAGSIGHGCLRKTGKAGGD